MEIEISGINIGLVAIAVGLIGMGYFIGKGLQNLGQPDKGKSYYHFIKESDLSFYLNLNDQEIEELLHKYPDAPKVELGGTTYYPYEQFMQWVTSSRTYKQ